MLYNYMKYQINQTFKRVKEGSYRHNQTCRIVGYLVVDERILYTVQYDSDNRYARYYEEKFSSQFVLTGEYSPQVESIVGQTFNPVFSAASNAVTVMDEFVPINFNKLLDVKSDKVCPVFKILDLYKTKYGEFAPTYLKVKVWHESN